MSGHSSSADAASEPVGSVAEEAFKLFRAMASQPQTGAQGDDSATHVCTNTWCPVCQVAGFVRDNPEALAKVSESAAQLTRSLRELIDTALTPREET
ncbi:hypothetical protein ASE12_00800 [Aeromicrobium sp. Root236]|uniref:hypothetical protein n=1 Tax=Aeromicrobium sp. Root236 TaxID=1736498 RepID=UPI0006FA5DCF|nr:hypothetical protein [Aeromicrobium sp. Root236]KRC63421.1 hypothetical protein ASE12_00800 [Aeromicrobium sp. Root236]